jgi:ATPase family associated with various cellular activities (AAA)
VRGYSIGMAKEIATPKVTAGGGFSFEDKTVAYLLACLLDDKPPLDSNLGTIELLDFQVRVDGWHLDDVVITLNANGTRRRCAMSVKSNQQFTKDAAPGEFVTAAWEIFLDPGRMNFDRTHDLLGIATAPLDAEFHSQLHELLSWARAQRSGDLPGRVAEKGYGNNLKRSLLKSFACPAGLAAAQGRTNAGTGEMLKCVQHVTFDFELVPSNDLARAISLCREALRSGELLEAEKLWDALCGIARDNRPVSGSIDITRLLDLVRGRFHLKSYPQFGSDWGRIAEYTKDNIVRISDLIGGKAALVRGAEETALKSSDSVFTALIGPSGCGKTVLAKKVVQLASENQATFWINAASLDTPDFRAFESNLNLQHSLADLFAACPVASAILVIDGLDRQFNDSVFENAATLVEKLGVTRGNSPWRVILPSQPEEWNRVYQLLTKANLRVKWSTFNLPEPLDLKPVWEVFPKLRPLSLRPELSALSSGGRLFFIDISYAASGRFCSS